MGTTFAGIFRAGTDGHALWEGDDWTGFQSKWTELSKQNLRLVDLETYVEGGKRKWAGAFRAGTDAHYLWVGASWTDFTAKWTELAKQNLRLVDVEVYDDGGLKWCGVWRAGSDAHYLWADEWTGFEAKWEELSKQNLRLVDIDTYVDGGKRKWVGVWRAGSDAHYLWAGVSWTDFTAKWTELAKQNLRLVDVETYLDGGTRKWAGVWRAGSDGYALWSAVDVENFLGEWNTLSHQGLRLVKFAPLDSGVPDACANHVVSRDKTTNAPVPYVYYVTGDTSGGPYSWPVDDNQYARLSALTFDAKPFTLPFTDTAVVHWGTWMYSAPPGNWHHAIDYLRPNDWHTFEVKAAAPGKVVFSGYDDWSGNTLIVSHDVGGVPDSFRSIYMHLRNGPAHDQERAKNQSLPTLSGATKTNYQAYLNAHANDAAYWGTDAHKIDANIVGRHVQAGDHLAWSGCTGPGGCGATEGPISHPNTHLHLFTARKDPANGTWYFIDPYGVYSYPDGGGYPPAVTGGASAPCRRYSVAWKNGGPQYP
jgi:hypothetical protein